MKRPSRTQHPWADHYTLQARKDHFAARSVYKLQEIQKKFRVLERHARVLDLGCAPGSWLQYAADQVGPQGRLVGIDLKPVVVALPTHVTVITGDVADLEGHLIAMGESRFNIVISDMAPGTTGNRVVDEARSVGLCEAALAIADQWLETGGHFVCKIFQGSDFKTFSDAVKRRFEQVTAFRPQSTRKASREVFIIGRHKK